MFLILSLRFLLSPFAPHPPQTWQPRPSAVTPYKPEGIYWMHPSSGIILVHQGSKWEPGWESHLSWWSMIRGPKVDLYCSRPDGGSSVRLMLSLTCVLLLNWIMKRWGKREKPHDRGVHQKAARGGLSGEGCILGFKSGEFFLFLFFFLYKRCGYVPVSDTFIIFHTCQH